MHLAYTDTPSHATVAATTASVTVLGANADRSYALFVNNSDVTMWLMVGAAAVADEGIRLNANGGSYEMISGQNLFTDVVNVIHAGAGNKTIIVTSAVTS